MLSSQNSFLRIMITLLIIFIVWKMLPVLNQFLFGNKGRKKNTMNELDSLIRKKEQEFRSGPSLKSQIQQSISTSKTTKSSMALKDLMDLNLEGKDKEKWSDIINSLQWGESHYLKHLIKVIEADSGIRARSSDLVRIIKILFLVHWQDDKCPNLSSFTEFIKIFGFIDSVLNETYQMERASVFLKMAPLELKKSMILLLLWDRHALKSQIFETLLTNDFNHPFEKISQKDRDELVTTFLTRLFHEGNDFLKNFLKLLQEEALQFSLYSPLPEPDELDLNRWALTILQLDLSSTEEQIKKSYRKLAGQKHPDKLSNKKLNGLQAQIIHENFVKIQRAYDILKKGGSK